MFQFGRVFGQAKESYKALDPENRGVLNTYLLILAAILAGIFYLESQVQFSETPWGKGLQSVLLGVWIAVTFAVLDRLNILSPIQEQINRRIGTLDQTVARINDKANDLDGYNKYAHARQLTGFNSIVGIEEVARREGAAQSRFASTNLIVHVLNEADPGDEVRYMTTFIKDYDAFLAALGDALRRGVAVKLLLMMPCSTTPIVAARHMDFLTTGETVQQFARRIRGLGEIILRARDHFQTNGQPFEVMFYSKTLHFPLIIVTKRRRDDLLAEIAYTGFYVQKSAELMPYIEWRGGDFQIANLFKSVFDQKWAACSSAGLREINCDAESDA